MQFETVLVGMECLFKRLADVRVTGPYTSQQHFLSSFLLVFIFFLLFDLEHDLKEVPDVPKKLDPARQHSSKVYMQSYNSLTSLIAQVV